MMWQGKLCKGKDSPSKEPYVYHVVLAVVPFKRY